MARCNHCKHKFEAKEFNQKFCKQSLECKTAFGVWYVNKVKEKQHKDWKKRKAEMADRIKTHSDWCGELQKRVNTIVRLIDKGSICVSSLKHLNDKYDAGHRFSVGAFPSIRFHLMNIHAQSVHQNQYLSGNPDGYDHGLECIYGSEYLKEVHDLRIKYPSNKVTIPELQLAIARANKIIKELKTLDLVYPPTVRIELRKKYNEKLGIYK